MSEKSVLSLDPSSTTGRSETVQPGGREDMAGAQSGGSSGRGAHPFCSEPCGPQGSCWRGAGREVPTRAKDAADLCPSAVFIHTLLSEEASDE